MQIELNSCFKTIRELREIVSSSLPFTMESLQQAEYVKFYTRLPNFKLLFDFVSSSASTGCSSTTKLTPFQEFMIMLAKLRLDSPLQDFAYQLIYQYLLHPGFFSNGLLLWILTNNQIA